MNIKKPQGNYAISAVICTFNEERNLPFVLPRIPDWVDEVLLVDAYSTDNTVKIARQLLPKIKIIYQPGTGKGDAMKYGIEQTTGDIVVLLDADGQNDPQEIGEIIKPLLNGYDFSKGSRLAKGRPQDMSFRRWAGNWGIVLACDILNQKQFTDLCSGYNAFWRKRFLDIKPWANENWGYEPLLIARVLKHKLKVKEVSQSYTKRKNGQSRLPDFTQGFTAIKVLIRERFRG